MTTWQQIVDDLFDVIEELVADRNLKPGEKLDALAIEVGHVIESLDSAALMLLPPGVGLVAQLLIDNPAIDQMERDIITKPLAEMLYQMWKFKQLWLGKGA